MVRNDRLGVEPQPLHIPQPSMELLVLVGHVLDSRNNLQKNALEQSNNLVMILAHCITVMNILAPSTGQRCDYVSAYCLRPPA